jgi:hypothetical protein
MKCFQLRMKIERYLNHGQTKARVYTGVIYLIQAINDH